MAIDGPAVAPLHLGPKTAGAGHRRTQKKSETGLTRSAMLIVGYLPSASAPSGGPKSAGIIKTIRLVRKKSIARS